MSEKILGFSKKVLKNILESCLSQYSEMIPEWNDRCSLVEKEDECEKYAKRFIEESLDEFCDVPVRLASENVDLKKLKEWCKKNHWLEIDTEPDKIMPRNRAVLDEDALIEWAEKEAKKK